MPGLLGAESVLIDLAQNRDNFGKVITSGVVNVRNSTDVLSSVSWANMYIPPIDETSAIGRGGSPNKTSLATLWRTGETTDVRADYQIVANSVTYLVVDVRRRMDADLDSNFCIYDCTIATNPSQP